MFALPLNEKRIISFIVSLALFMDALDATIINTAIPAMSRSLNVYPVDLKIALISYLVTLAIFIPISGWMADKFGAKRVFISALAIFTISSFWCGYASTLTELVMARSAQGLGGAMMLPIGRLIILRTFPRHEIVTAMNQVVMVVSLGLMLGPVLGGFLTDRFSWHWIFWVNIPVGLFAIIIAENFLKDSPRHTVPPFDKLGFILFGGGLAGLTFAMSDLSETTANHRMIIMIMLSALIMLITFIAHARQQRHPIVKISLLKYRTFHISLLGNVLSRLGFGAVPFLLPLLLQVALGYSAELSGMLMVPIAMGVLVIKSVALQFLQFFGYKRLLMINTILVGLIMWLFQIINHATPIYQIAGLTFIFGLLISLQFSGMNSLGYADIPAEDLSAATSIVSTVQQISQSFGVAVGAFLIRMFATSSGQGFELTPSIFHQIFFTMGVITMLSALLFMRLKPEDGHQMLKAPSA